MTTRALIGLALVAALASGCAIARAGGRAAGSLFESPRKVDKLRSAVDPEARLAISWVGHATVLVQMDDKLILTDPVFTPTVGQVSKRLVEPGIDPKTLPALDAVVVSHMHFDHLSLGSLDMIEPKVRTLLMPRGGVTYLTDFSFPVVELRTWQAWEKDGLRITAAPVDHVGYRYGIDDAWMKESFTGYVIEYHGMTVYFGGDTAYEQRMFAETGMRFPDIDVALLPIGPIEPHDLMRRFHMDPAQAVRAMFDLGAKRMVPIHYDTFINSTDAPGDALAMLEATKAKTVMAGKEIVEIPIGQRRVFLKKGEGPDEARGFAVPASPVDPSPPPEAPPPPPPAKSTIPDDDRLD
ncbi:MAG: MBL fold metallo-hydrolase [Labilithrix sp.]|nr:MBL fold metallo-hydrolase [Labilithrix sp.]